MCGWRVLRDDLCCERMRDTYYYIEGGNVFGETSVVPGGQWTSSGKAVAS